MQGMRGALCALVVCSWGVAASAQEKPASRSVFPYPVEQFSLKNGLQVVLIPRPGTGLLAYYTLMRVGSRNEVEPGRSGYAHFFEHMMFRGTDKYPQAKYEDVIKTYGANNNAYTDDDLTLYTIMGRADGLEKFVEIEADRFQHLKYSKAAFETESKAVLGEYNKSKSNPESRLYEAMCATAFTRHPYKHTTIGFEADVRAMPQGFDYSLGFFRNYYTPDNATVLVVGDFEPQKAKALITAAYSGWKGKAALPGTQKEPPQKAERRVVVPWETPAQPRLLMAWHVPEASSTNVKEMVAAELVEDLLFGPTSALHQELVLDQQLSDELGAWFQEHRDPHLFMVGATSKDQASLGLVEERILASVEKAGRTGVDEEQLRAVKSHQKYALLASLEKLDHVSDVVANTMSPTGSLGWMDEQFAALDAVTNQDIMAFINTRLTKENRTVATLVPPAGNGGTP